MPNSPLRSPRPRWLFVIPVLFIFTVLFISIPHARASLGAWMGLSTAPSNQVPAEAVTLVAITPPTLATPATAVVSQAAPMQSATAALTPASAQATAETNPGTPQPGWKILTPASLPEGYQYQSTYYDTNHQMVILTYLVTRKLPDSTLTASKTITLLQAQKNNFVPMQIAPDARVEDAQVNGQPAASIIGAWDTEFVKDDKDPNGGKMVSTWRSDLQVKNLYWQFGPIYLALVTDDAAVSQQDLLDMAASVGK